MFAESNPGETQGVVPTDTVAITELFAVLITETVPSTLFVTYILLFVESNAMPLGVSPTDTVAITELFAVLITETVSSL